jgi:hypothetical protein
MKRNMISLRSVRSRLLTLLTLVWIAASGGSLVAANSPAQIAVGVTNGLFVLPLNFASNFPGADRSLYEHRIRPAFGNPAVSCESGAAIPGDRGGADDWMAGPGLADARDRTVTDH